MIKIEEKIKIFFKSNRRTAVLVLFLLEFFLSIWITPNRYDSEFFIGQMREMSLGSFLSMRYQTWTSRLLIEAVVCSVLPRGRILWAIINTIMMTILGYSMLKLWVDEDDKSLTGISIILLLIYPLNKIATCDWGAGSINYTWPLAMLLFACIPIKKIWREQKIRKFEYPFYSLALLFACNQEQACMIAFGIYVVFMILDIVQNKKKFHPFLVVQCILVILSLLFIATCPGNYERKNEEIATYYTDFETLNLLDKVSLGMTSTVNDLLVNTNVVFFVFSLVSAVFICRKYKENWYRVTAFIPVVLSVLFGALKNVSSAVFPYFDFFYDIISSDQAMLTPENYLNFLNFIPLILAFLLLGSVLMNLLLIFRGLKNNIALLIYLLGVASRIAMGFSPTVFASTDRTFLFFDFALIMISILVWKEFLQETDKSFVKSRTKLTTVVAIFACLQYLHTLIYVMVSQM